MLSKYIVSGGTPLKGEVNVSGSKNASVAIIPAVMLSDGVCRLENVPDISDTATELSILYDLGADIKMINRTTYEIDPRGIRFDIIHHEKTKVMRGSYYFIGAMLGRFGKAKVALPGGCNFGVRPIDQHIKGFEALGCDVTLEHGLINVETDGLLGAQVYLDVVSVGATMNIMLAACKARGLTVIENAAKEPHIVDLANFLNSMGADIMGAGTDVIKIRGVSSLKGTTYSIIPDQIEAGTYMVAAAATAGDVLIKNVIPKHLESISTKLIEAGAEITEYDEAIRVTRTQELKKINLKTMPHPGFPTDMQPQTVVMLSVANGTSIVTESIFDNRFRYVEQLTSMGAKIQVDGKIAVVEGVKELKPAPISATDLRAGAAMIIAGLITRGCTEIEDIHHIERGYENLVGKFVDLGASIEMKKSPEIFVAKAQ